MDALPEAMLRDAWPNSSIAGPRAGCRGRVSERRSRTLDAIAAGALGLLVDEATLGGEGRGIFFAAAVSLAAEQTTIMATRGRGIHSVALDEPAARRLGLCHMPGSHAVFGDTPTYLVSIEAVRCPGTGISAEDRALTIRVAGDPASTAADIATPGHILPLLVRRPAGRDATLAELAFALMRSLDAANAVAWCDILNDGGDVASAAHCRALAKGLRLPWISTERLRAEILRRGPG